MNSNNVKHYVRTALSLLAVSVMTGCAEDMPETAPEPHPETTEVELSVTLGSGWNIDTEEEGASRAAPPGTGGNNDPGQRYDGEAETMNVNKVHVVVFRRKSAGETAGSGGADGSGEPFMYDVTNDMILDVEDAYISTSGDKYPEPHKHKVAHGKLKKVYGFEYRVLAVAYDSNLESSFGSIFKADGCQFSVPKGEDNWFVTNKGDNVTIDQFKATISQYGISIDNASWRDFLTGNPSGGITAKNGKVLSNTAAQIPQLFYGECHTESNGVRNDIIRYAETDAGGELVKDLPVSGVLYRGMAKVELHIKPTPQKGAFGSEHAVKWICLMADNVYKEVGLSSYDDFLHPSKEMSGGRQLFTALSYCNVTASGQEQVLTTYMLPCKTRLAVRIKTDGGDVRNAQLTSVNTESAGTGTGIISPDLHDGVFYLRRNHRYILTVSDSEALFNEHQLK